MLKQYVVQSDSTSCIISPEDSDNDIRETERCEKELNRRAGLMGFVSEIKFELQNPVLLDQQTTSSEVEVSPKKTWWNVFQSMELNLELEHGEISCQLSSSIETCQVSAVKDELNTAGECCRFKIVKRTEMR